MPIFKFDPQKSVIFCHAEIAGKGIELSLKMAVDTGATYTMIPVEEQWQSAATLCRHGAKLR